MPIHMHSIPTLLPFQGLLYPISKSARGQPENAVLSLASLSIPMGTKASCEAAPSFASCHFLQLPLHLCGCHPLPTRSQLPRSSGTSLPTFLSY